MNQRQIAGISVGEIGLGCMGMSQSHGPSRSGLILTHRPEQASFNALSRALLGIQ